MTVLVDFGEVDEEKEGFILVFFEQFDRPGAYFFILHEAELPDVQRGVHIIIRRAGHDSILDAVFLDDFTFGFFLSSGLAVEADFLWRVDFAAVFLFADDRDGDEIVGSEVFLEAFEDAKVFGDGLIASIAVNAGDFGVIAGENLGPAGLGVGGALDINLDISSLVDQPLQAGQFPELEQLVDVVALGAVPADEYDVLRFCLAHIGCERRGVNQCQAYNGED